MRGLIILPLLLGMAAAANAAASSATGDNGDYIIKVAPERAQSMVMLENLSSAGNTVDKLSNDGWYHVKANKSAKNLFSITSLAAQPGILFVQPNYKLHLLEDYRIQDPKKRAQVLASMGQKIQNNGLATAGSGTVVDNPAIPAESAHHDSGKDPFLPKQWGMNDIGVQNAWLKTKGSPSMIVAVIDTGVDYTHEDLVENLWRNPGETGIDANGRDKSNNGIDDDNNGFVDDVIGWDFADNDNKPFDMPASLNDLLTKGGNPGHGTHCSGNVAARADNGKGIAGVAPGVKIMGLRFITTAGSGTTADAVKAIRYAVDNGARVLSNSWGSEGEDAGDAAGNQALKSAIQYAQSKNVLFVAAAGNGHNGVGYNNDTDSKPGIPASYPNENIISVAAIDSGDRLGSFSNWGLKTVHIGAPGVKVFSSMVGGLYSDYVIEMLGVTWDGTSMATPHVAGAAALYWSLHPEKSFADVKQAIINSAKRIPALQGKSVSGGKLDVQALMNY